MFILIEMSTYDQEDQLDVRMVLLYAFIPYMLTFSSYGRSTLVSQHQHPSISYFCLLKEARVCDISSKDLTVVTQAPSSKDYATVAFLYMHLLHDFLVEPSRCILTRVSGVDTRLLRWLLASLGDAKQNSASGVQHSNHWVWQTAVAAYALTVGSLWPQDGENSAASAQVIVEDLDQPHRVAKGRISKSIKKGGQVGKQSGLADNSVPALTALIQPRGGAQESAHESEAENDRLLELRTWTEETVSEWRTSQRMVQWKNAGIVLQKIEWLRTSDGMKALEQMCLESEADDEL